MDKKELIEKVVSALRSYIADLEWGGGYDDNEGYKHGLAHAAEVRTWILELKKL